ncbi:GNAT family N-acetyltransferase [Sphingomonas glacialis]|uniref:N-acetyltransferase n=1 Tax=Sphingomonas glacialis TaxID=658225 RepID=A0A502FZS2_9SPHN|nr:GNAT family N-acetyltransferase [Sphingomonas glacialis]TPG54546.1 N-acetyltransferase [Sphingomonas glacialis]
MIETPRLRLRAWREDDKPAFAGLVNTPAMMAHFGGVRPRVEIDALIDAQMAKQSADGHCMWAVETRGDGALVGICGLRIGGHPDTPVDGMYELGWRIAERYWGQGIAREAAEASRDWGWANTPARTIAAWTNPGNAPSWGLMFRIGMTRRPDLDFRHPRFLESDDPIGDMIVYAIDRP